MSPHHGEVIIPQNLNNEPTECRTDTKATSHHPQDNGAIIHTLINAFWKTKVDRFDQTVKHIFLENNKSINALRNTSIKDLLSHIQFTPNKRQPQGYEFFLHPAINSVLKEESSEATKSLLDSISDHHIIFTNEGKCASESCTHILDQISDTPKVKNLYHDALKTVGYGRPGAHHKDFEEHNCPFDPRLYFGKVLLPSLHLPSLHHVPKESVEQNLFLNVDDISNLLEQHTMKYRMFLKSLDSEPSVTIPDDADTSFTSNNESDAMEVQFSNILRLLREDSKSDKAFNILLSEDVRTIWRQHRAKSLPPIGRPNGKCMWSGNDSIDLDFSFGNPNKISPKQEVFEFDRILKAKEILDSPPCLETKHSFVTNDSCTLSLTNHDSNLSDKTINIGTDKDETMNDEEVSSSPIAERIDVVTNDSPVQTTQNDPGGYGYSVSWSTDDCSDDMIHDDDGAAIPTIMNQGRNMLGDTAEWPLLNQNEWSEDSPIWPETSPQQQRDECNYAVQQASNVEDTECTRTCILPGMSREAPDGAPSEHKIAKQSASYTSISDPDIYQSCVQESNSKVRGYKATRMRMKEQLHKHITKDRANHMAPNKVNDWKVCEAKDETVNPNATEFRAPNILNIRVPVKISQAPNPQAQNSQSHFSQISNPQSQRFQGHFSHASNSHGQSSQGQYSHVPSSRSHITQGNISQFPNAKYDVLPPIDSTSHLPNDCGVSRVGLAHGVSMTDGRNDQVRVQPNRWGLWENIPNADSTKQIVNTSNVATVNQQHRFLTPVYNMNKPRQLQMPNNRQPHQQMEVNPYIIPAPPPILSQPPPMMIQQRELQQIAMLDVAPPSLPNLQHIQNPYLLPPQHNPTMACCPRLNMPPPPPNCPPPTQWNTQLSNNLTTIRSKVPSYSSQMQHMNVIQQQQQPLPPPPPFPLVTSWAQPPLWPSARVNQDNLINIPTNKHTIDKTVQSGAADEIAPTNSTCKAVRSEFTSTATCSSIKEDKPKLDVNSPEFVPERMKTREELRASAKLPEITLHNSKNIQCVINEANKLLRQIYKGDSDNLDNKLEDSETPYQKLVREVLGNTKKSEDIGKVKCSPSKVKNESDIINLKADDSKPGDTTSINAPSTRELSNGNINTFQEVKTKRAFLKHIKTLKK
ncbi:unnamed protein product [Owenia fusiformis]|uniref:Uncharacterized protein n=1 Tax=Owenia fusiformis TaxID=6347 RepID=A0A8J1U9P6_OWEFU|nr:unnamed protein product [Owenia fusiformis]